MTNIWQDDDFAERYAVLNASGTNSYEHDVNEQSILSLIPSGVNSVLDYGCSSGHFTARLSDKYEVVGYDIAKSARDVAKSLYPKLTITGGGGIGASAKFDCIVIKMVLHLVAEPRTVLIKLAPHLTDSGYFVISIPHPVEDAYKLGIDYGRADQFMYQHEVGKMGLESNMYWRPLKYWIDLFSDLGFGLVRIDEPMREARPLPERFNACFKNIPPLV